MRRSGHGCAGERWSIPSARSCLARAADVQDVHQVREDHPGQHGLTLRRPPESLALGLDAGVAKDEGTHLARDGYRCTVHVRPGNAASGPSCSRCTTLTTAMRTCCSFPTPSSPPSAASTTRAEARSKTRGSSYPRRKGGPSPRARQACESAQGYTNERRGPRRCAGICTQADSRSAGPTGCGAVRLRTWRESTPEGDSVSPNRLRGGRAKGRRAWLTPPVSVSLPDW